MSKFKHIILKMSNLICISRVIITQPSTTGRPCPNTLIEIKPCESTPCYKWIKTPWKCDLQVGSYFISVILHKPFLWFYGKMQQLIY